MAGLQSIKFIQTPAQKPVKTQQPREKPKPMYKEFELHQDEKWKKQMSLEQFVLKEQRNAYKK